MKSKHREERDQREETRRRAFEGQQKMEGAFRSIGDAGYKPASKASLAERSKYQFEADSEVHSITPSIFQQVKLTR